jgi:hypothetical protein
VLTSFDRRARAVLLPVALAMRVAVAWAPIEWLLRRVLGDDPFYYFTIARHLAAGHGFTFDGVEPTNGFHPLWLLIITPVFGVVRDPTLAVHVALTVAACVDVVALFLLHRLLRESGVRPAIAAAAAALYALSPLVLSGAGPMNGLETALNLALTVAFLTAYRRALIAPAPGAAAGVRLGVWSGLLFLTRTDNAILLLCCHVWLFWRARRGGGRGAIPAASIAIAAIIAAPWLAWSWARFGSPVQVSGLAIAHVTRELAGSPAWLSAAVVTKLLHNLATLATYVPIYRVNERSFVAAAAGNAIIVAALATGTVLCYRGDAPEGRRAFVDRLAPWAAPAAASGLFIATHTLRALELRGWYYSAIVPVAALVLAVAADYVAGFIATAPAATRRLLSGAAAIVVAVVLAASLRVGAGRRCGELDGYAMIAAINQTPHVHARLASWNAGLFGYFYERGEVVNLDGLVNNAAYAAILTRSVGAYAARRDVDYLLDAAGAIELAKPYWDGGRPVTLRAPTMDNAAARECRSIVLVPLR